MKFIKYAVGLVIALSVIPMVVVAVTKLDEPRLRTVEFEVVDIDGISITVTDNTYNNLLLYSTLDGTEVTNLLSVKLNDLEQPNCKLWFEPNDYFVYTDDNDNDWTDLIDTDIFCTEGYTPTIGDKWTMTFEVPNPTPPLIKLLVGFAPLLFVGGILLFMLNKRKLD